MDDGIGLAEALLGLSGFRLLDVIEDEAEVVIRVETTAVRVFCRTCGVRAEPHDRMRVDIRDLACFGRPARLVWIKRRWRCREALCSARTWTEHSEHVDAQAVLTRRAGVEACRQVGENARPDDDAGRATTTPPQAATTTPVTSAPATATVPNDSAVPWQNYDEMVRERIADLAAARDCAGLQSEFGTADANDSIQRNRVGTGNAELLNYLDALMRAGGCYD